MSTDSTPAVSAAPATEATYVVAGMSCDHCRVAVAQEVGGVAGVDSVEVDLGMGRVRVSGAGFDDAAILEAIGEAGYEGARS
ncbi:MAG: heavy-metal-associated domain-containing protein [Actinobacteria bacterium]|nr:heavy-metal-associated domain-containing protein [Actinomycetota bacterium]